MKVMATFDGSRFGESIIGVLTQIAALPNVEMTLLSVSEVPAGRARTRAGRPIAAVPTTHGGPAVVLPPRAASFVETKDQAIQRRLDERTDYLHGIGRQLPRGTQISYETHVSRDPAATIIERARAEKPDVIVMATHGRTGLVRALFGSVAERVVHAGVAPVLLVHPEKVRKARSPRRAAAKTRANGRGNSRGKAAARGR
jgi:nucleotide-binding universal stress UspA family protein